MQGVYKHYKNKLYFVLGESTHSETMESMVVYQALYGDYGLWVRPKAMFVETLDNGSARFSFVADKLTAALIDEYQVDLTKLNPMAHAK